MRRIHIFLFFCLCILIYLIFAMFAITESLIGDSAGMFISAKVFNNMSLQKYFSKTIGMCHPPLYVHLLSLIDKSLGLNTINVRLIGILSFIITLFMIYAIIQSVFRERNNKCFIGLMGVFLYTINPMAIQGSLLPDIDTTILVPLLLFFILIFLNLKGRNRYLTLGIIFALLLWTKFSTPFALIPTIFIFYSLKDGLIGSIKKTSKVFFIGFTVFIVSWWFYCHFSGRPFYYTVSHLWEAIFYERSIYRIVLNFVKVLIRLVLFNTPFYFLMFLLVFFLRCKEFFFKKYIHYPDFLLILSFGILFTYSFVGWAIYSFPKYHYPFISLSVIIIAGFITDKIMFKKEDLIFYIFLVFIVVVYNIFLVGDFLYTSDYALRESLIKNGKITYEVMNNLLIQIVLYILPFLLVLLVSKFKNDRLILYRIIFIWTIASCLSMDVLQAKADYNTFYCYGAKGTNEMVSFINKMKRRNGSIVAINDLFFVIDEKDFLTSPDYRINDRFGSKDDFISIVKNNNPDFIVFSISSNNCEQYWNIFNNHQVINFLKEDFKKSNLGSYTMWFRKDLLNIDK